MMKSIWNFLLCLLVTAMMAGPAAAGSRTTLLADCPLDGEFVCIGLDSVLTPVDVGPTSLPGVLVDDNLVEVNALWVSEVLVKYQGVEFTLSAAWFENDRLPGGAPGNDLPMDPCAAHTLASSCRLNPVLAPQRVPIYEDEGDLVENATFTASAHMCIWHARILIDVDRDGDEDYSTDKAVMLTEGEC